MKALVVGASSGIGRALALELGRQGYEVGLMARRVELLEEVAREMRARAYVGYVDVAQAQDAVARVEGMLEEMGGADLIVLNAGVLRLNPNLAWIKEAETIAVNVTGTCALAGLSYRHLKGRGGGNLVGISSVSAHRGYHALPAYSASKAFLSNYLEGLRGKAFKERSGVVVTDIKPGYVETDMVKGMSVFWMASAEEAARQIYRAVRRGRSHAYITRRWRLMAWLERLMPDWLYFRL